MHVLTNLWFTAVFADPKCWS